MVNFSIATFSFISCLCSTPDKVVGQAQDRLLTSHKHTVPPWGCSYSYYSRTLVYGLFSLFHTDEEQTHEGWSQRLHGAVTVLFSTKHITILRKKCQFTQHAVIILGTTFLFKHCTPLNATFFLPRQISMQTGVRGGGVKI